MTHRDFDEHDVDLAAAEWVVRVDRGLSASEQRELTAWLAADPRHRAWYERHDASWRAFDGLRRGEPAGSSRPGRRRRCGLYWWLPVALAAAAALALWVHVSTRPVAVPVAQADTRMRRSDVVAGAEGESQVLSDGSVVDLRPGAAITIAFNRRERGICLRRGEAQFHVAHNTQWPFIVHAAGVAVRAVGTAFDVRVKRTAVEVMVTEGHVQVNTPAAGPVVAPCQLLAGQRTVVSLRPAAAAPRVIAATTAELNRTVGWQARWLEFDSAPLPQVIAQFNRYNRVQMEIADPSLAALPIVASFRAGNVDGFVRLLRMTAGVQATRHGDVISLSAGAPAATR